MARSLRWLAVLLLASLLAACSSGGSDNHPLMWQSSPPVGLLKDQPGEGPDPVVHRITAEAGDGGSVNPASTTAVHGSSSLLTIIPEPGYRIDEVQGCGGELVAGARYLTAPVTAPCTVTATFAIESYTVTTLVRSNRGGATAGDGVFEYGAEATVTATPDPGFVFVNWTDGPVVVSDDAVYTFEVRSNHSLSASFDIAKNAAAVKMPPGRVTLFEAGNAPAGVVFAATREGGAEGGVAGIWRSADAGGSWERTSDIEAVFIAIASGDPDLVVAGHAGGYLVSQDGGLTWTAGSIVAPGGALVVPDDAAAVTAEGGIFAAVAAIVAPGLYRSLDAGASWQRVLGPAQAPAVADVQLRHVAVSPGDPLVIHAATGGNRNLWRSADGATSFASIRDGIALDQPQVFDAGLRVDAEDPPRILVESHLSLNGGADWTPVQLPPRTVLMEDPLGQEFEVELGEELVSPRNTVWLDGRLLRVEADRLMVSDDGASWTELLELVGDSGDFDTGRIFLAEDALYLQLTGGPNLVHRVDLDTILEALEAP